MTIMTQRGPAAKGCIASLLMLVLAGTLLFAGPAAAAETPRYGGTFIIGSGGDPSSLNLAASFSNVDTLAAAPIFNCLVKSDSELNPKPDLAESWKVSDDGLTYTFNLVKNARWHDGKPFTSADVKYTFDEVLGKIHPRGSVALKVVDSIETPGPLDVHRPRSLLARPGYRPTCRSRACACRKPSTPRCEWERKVWYRRCGSRTFASISATPRADGRPKTTPAIRRAPLDRASAYPRPAGLDRSSNWRRRARHNRASRATGCFR